MRIVQHTFDFGLGGVQKGPILFALEMARRGHECWMLAESGGPRHRADAGPNVRHVVLGSADPAVAARAIDEISPNVVHIHRAAYVEPLVRLLAKRPGRLIVSTPVFGRPPEDRSLLGMTRTCLVGCYTFYRYCRWMGLSGEEAVAAQGIGYVPITPYAPPASEVSTLDPPEVVSARRAELGVPAGAFIVGRIGREDVSKWSDLNEGLVDALLGRFPNAAWLSIGFPQSLGRDRLAARWGKRFLNFGETADYQLLARVLSSMDVFAFFSNGECFASSIAEAAGMGVPTVALATPLRDNGQVEQVVEGVTGRVVGNVEQACEFVGELMRDGSMLAALKASSRRHAHQRWHVERVTEDLLSLYEYWGAAEGEDRSGKAPPAYAQLMLGEYAAFARDYRDRMVGLMGRSAASRLKWRAALAAAESWTTFRAGRLLKRLRRR